jgi:acetolactate synthase-1/2/3 large subunit
MTRTGGQALVAQLERQGVDTIFCVPGESYLPVLDALHDSPIRLVSARHEASAANMAEAYGKLTGRPGICLVTRGPGSTQAAVGVHTADQGSTPLLLLVGQVPRAVRGRQAFQELDYASTFGGMAKRVVEVDDPDHLPEEAASAFRTALEGRPGPVVLALPEDVLAGETDAPDAEVREPDRPQPTERELERLRELLDSADRPLVLVGEGGWTADAARDVLAFAEASELPVAASFRCQDYVDNRSRVYAGHLTIGMDPKLAGRVRDADLVVAIGSRLGDVATEGYVLLAPPLTRQTLVHVHPAAGELGRVYRPELAICSDLSAFAAAVRALDPVEPRWREWTAAARADYEANARAPSGRADLDLAAVVSFLRGRLPDDAILTSGAGNFTVWAHRFFEFRQYGTQLAPQSGAMGYGLPAAIAAKVVRPRHDVVCLAGDGDFLMAGAELATAVKEGLAVVVLVVNNGMYGTIRMHQERLYPGRVVGTDLVNPDFAAYAEAFGAHGETVERTADVEAAFERAIESGGLALLDLRVDPEAISPRATIAELRARAGA